MDKTQQTKIQAKVFTFAFSELVLNQRDSFEPLWTIESWAKFLIWMSLNCGFSGEKESLELFAEALGMPLTSRMRKLFFERTVNSLSARLIADPGESHLFLMPLNAGEKIDFDKVGMTLKDMGLSERLDLISSNWNDDDGVISIPWKSLESNTSLSKNK